MKTELKAKFLQHLNQKKQDEGFTLIELLVVIIIIGILAAIALPSFLSQANKGKQSEAKTYVGSLNKAQQANFTEKSVFIGGGSAAIPASGIGIKTQTVNYIYGASTAGAGTASYASSYSSIPSNITAPLKNYTGYVSLILAGTGTTAGAGEYTSIAVLCESKTAGGFGTTPLVGTGTSAGAGCNANQVQVGGTQ
ncbi:type IV pilin-like G/H family protein [Coleofasciculus sp. FACHB-129]|uniref:type IV pilin-like G/H family protein n=1 Tax=Cyanophyceae TaxID=3028117 RepID=UPI00168A06EC|nr:type IV pilin-like G/H family protein [Coleofasciculus sp. FACHB-129]MBD1896184.1 prepilin-type N-terminal cleavage/methylation domain-containing protein [Coleofasciculus sp. FACHB-129]